MMVLAMSIALPLSDNAFARGGRGGGMGGGGGGAPQGNPALTQDRAALTTASTAYNQAQKDYNEAKNKIDAEFRKQPDYADAQKAVDDANKALGDTHDAVEADLKKNSKEYQASLAADANNQKKLDELKVEQAPQEEIAAQSAKLFFDSQTEKILQAGLDASAPYSDAKKKRDDALAALKVQKDKMADAEKAGRQSFKNSKTKWIPPRPQWMMPARSSPATPPADSSRITSCTR